MAWYNQEEHEVAFQEASSLTWGNVARMAGQGVTFGWSDEILAALRSKLGDEDYETLVTRERDAMDKFKKEHPTVAYGTEIVSSFFVPGAAARLGVRGGLAGAKGLAKLAGAGAAESALYGAGVAEEGGRAAGATTGGVVGAVAGPAISKGGGAAARYLGRRFGADGARAQGRHIAETKVLQAADEDVARQVSGSPGLAARLDEDVDPIAVLRGRMSRGDQIEPTMGRTTQRAGQDMDMLADVEGGSVRRLAMGATAESPTAYGKAADVLNVRLGKEFDDLIDITNQQMRVTHRATAMADEAAIRVSDASNKFYDDAYRMADLPMADFRKILNNKKVRDAYQNLKGDMDIMVETAPLGDIVGGGTKVFKMVDWEDFIKGESVSTRLIHRLKQELDDTAGWGSRDPSVRVNPIRSVIKAINRVTSGLNPDYAKANKIFSIGPQMKEMVANGADAIKNLRPETIRRKYGRLSTFEKRSYRAGMVEEAIKPMDRDAQKSIANYFNRNTELKKKLRAVFRDDAEWNDFMGDIQKKITFRQTKTEILRTSGTAERIAARESLQGTASKVGGVALEATKMNIGNVATQLVGMLDNKFVAEEVGNLLFTGSKGATAAAIRRLLAKRRDLSGQDRITLGELIKNLKVATTIDPRRQMVGAGAAVTGSLLEDPRQSMAQGARGLLPSVF